MCGRPPRMSAPPAAPPTGARLPRGRPRRTSRPRASAATPEPRAMSTVPARRRTSAPLPAPGGVHQTPPRARTPAPDPPQVTGAQRPAEAPAPPAPAPREGSESRRGRRSLPRPPPRQPRRQGESPGRFANQSRSRRYPRRRWLTADRAPDVVQDRLPASRLRHHPELLHHHPGVGHAPVLDGTAVRTEPHDVRDRHADPLARRWDAHEVALVGALEHAVRDHHVALGQHVHDPELQVRERRPRHLEELLYAVTRLGNARELVVLDEVLRDQLVDDRRVASADLVVEPRHRVLVAHREPPPIDLGLRADTNRAPPGEATN